MAQDAQWPPVIPYDPAKLKWNREHTKNDQGKYCYCGKDRQLKQVSLQCEKCLNWFHDSCIRCDLKPIVPYICNYRFLCGWCNKGKELFERYTASWKNIIVTAIANCMLNREPRIHFSKEEIVPFLKENWAAVCTGRQQTKTWWATVGTCLSTSPNDFVPEEGTGYSAGSPYTLHDPDLLNLRPSSAGRADSSVVTNKTLKRKKEPGTERPKKEKIRSTKAELDQNYMEKLKKQGPAENLTNRDDFRYILAEQNPLIPDAFRERITNPGVFLSREDRSPFIQLSKDRLSAWTEKGFRLARASHYCYEGSWYFEVRIDSPVDVPLPSRTAENNAPLDGPHTRLGWSQRFATLEAPVGFDEFGFSYRDKTGDKVHLSMPVPYGETYGQGDVIGCLIYLPKVSKKPFATVHRERTVIVLKGTLYFEEQLIRPDRSEQNESTSDGDGLPRLPGSCVAFFKNGKFQGVAFSGIPTGDYYPSISLYRGAKVKMNFGPTFEYPPDPKLFASGQEKLKQKDDMEVDDETNNNVNLKSVPYPTPFSQRYGQQAAEDALADIIDAIEQ